MLNKLQSGKKFCLSAINLFFRFVQGFAGKHNQEWAGLPVLKELFYDRKKSNNRYNNCSGSKRYFKFKFFEF